MSLATHVIMLKSKYRSKQTIIADILKSAHGRRRGARKTNILQSANLNTAMLDRYLDVLMRNGYIMVEGHVYKPTKKGLVFLENVDIDIMKVKHRF